jgi:hypothetical protein
MEAKDIGKVIGAFALGMVPTVSGLYVYGKMKDEKSSTGASAVVGGLTLAVLGLSIALLNRYLFGLSSASMEIEKLVDSGSASSMSGARGAFPNRAFSGSNMMAGLPSRVFSPFSNDFRQVGALNIARRVGCCGR